MKRKRKRHFGILLAILICGCAAGGYYYVKSLAYTSCVVEAGVSVTPQDFLKKQDPNAFFTDKSDELHSDLPGQYRLYVKSGPFTHACTLRVQDTVPPTAEASPRYVEYGKTLLAEEFVSDVQDATAVTVVFRTKPDFALFHTQPIELLLTDLGGNETVLTTTLTVCPVVPELTVEAGSDVPSGDLFLLAGERAELLTAIADMNTPGEYPVEVAVDGETYPSVLRIKDTLPPVAEVCDLTGFSMYVREPEEFVARIEDATPVTVSYGREPDFSRVGSQEVELLFTDTSGNETVKTARLVLEADEEPPVIRGAVDLQYMMGTSITYRKNVTVTDNSGVDVELVIDNSQVNLNEPGVYPLVYSATDPAGNRTQITVDISVYAQTYDVEELYAKADEVLAKIFTPEMTEYDKLWAIYQYVINHVGYISDSEKETWERAAYEGLVKGQGDCYVFACTTKLLLERAGIVNMDIAKIPARTRHYWNLVDIGEGWRHLDTCPRVDHPVIFYWTDAELMAYSDRHNKSHNYDHSIYPEVP